MTKIRHAVFFVAVEKPDLNNALSNLASIGRYVLKPDIFDTLRGLSAGLGGEIQLADAINIDAQKSFLTLSD
ncbi:hypothetical protein N8Z37_01340 [Octadecabacter sp.]|nr:hypothetical protein [Octadecabacter sp.]